MKIAHWCTTIAGMSGLTHRVREILSVEKEMGQDARVFSTSFKEGKEDKGFRFEPWEWAVNEADINVIDSHVPPIFDDLPNRVFITHGAPYHCALSELYGQRTPLLTSILMVQQCELTITWNPHHAPIWKEFGGNVKTIIGGVDLKKWTPEGTKINFNSHPVVLVLDTPRDNKLPMQMLFATMMAQRKIPDLRLEWVAIPQNMFNFWHTLAQGIGIDIFTHMVSSAVANPEDFYRGGDIVIHPVSGGSIGGVGMEALACGCSVIIFEGEDEKICTEKCKEYDPESMRDSIFRIWDKAQSDPEGLRKSNREIAEKYYDLRRTVSEMLKSYEELI